MLAERTRGWLERVVGTMNHMRPSTVLTLLTMALVALGCVLYVTDSIGWAQCVWVLASGTAGGAVTTWLSEHPHIK